MKKTVAVFLAIVMVLPLCIIANASVPTEQEAYDIMIGLKSQYPEKTPWGNEKFYAWKGGIYNGGYGCAAFAFLLSDAVFGDLPARVVEDVQFEDVRAGDILRMNGDAHSVIVLRVFEDYVEIAEGSYNNAVHWGRILNVREVEGSDYLMTRYPQGTGDEKPDTPDLPTDRFIDGGNCGEYSRPNVKWAITDNGELYIYGTGEMETYSLFNEAPWNDYLDRITSVTFSGELFNVSSYGFHGFWNLKTVTLCDSIEEIGVAAFTDCIALTSVTMGKNVKNIYGRAFKGCSALRSIELPAGLRILNNDAFALSGLTEIVLPEGLTYLGSNAFEQCDSLVYAYIPGTVTNNIQYVFYRCDQLSSVVFGEGLEEIGRSCFAECLSLKTISFPSTMKEIGEDAFRYAGLESVILPEGIETLCKRAFSSCADLKTVHIPSTVTTFEGDVFSYCKALDTVTMAEGLSLLGAFAFQNCESLKTVTIPGSISTIPVYAFAYTGLTSVVIPEGVTHINKYAFEYSYDLTTVYFPTTLQAIGDGVFDRCDLTDVYYSGSREQWDAVDVHSGNYNMAYVNYHFGVSGPCTHAETVIIPAVAPGCELSGLTAGKKCANPACGEILEEQQYVAPKGHTWQEGVCFQPDTCIDCGAEQYMDRHDWAPADCTQPEICRLCGEARGVPGEHTLKQGSCIFCGEFVFVLGDLNGDGKVAPIDYMLLKRMVLTGSEIGVYVPEAWDINGNGKADPRDYLRLKLFVMHKVDSL